MHGKAGFDTGFFARGGGNHIFEEILDIFGQQNRQIQLYNFNSIFIGYRPV